jgi:hypothetical protein
MFYNRIEKELPQKIKNHKKICYMLKYDDLIM